MIQNSLNTNCYKYDDIESAEYKKTIYGNMNHMSQKI